MRTKTRTSNVDKDFNNLTGKQTLTLRISGAKKKEFRDIVESL